jgi:hypothetical protein
LPVIAVTWCMPGIAVLIVPPFSDLLPPSHTHTSVPQLAAVS